MRDGGGKQKGSQFERLICWKLSRFIDPQGEDTLFWRSAMSGGRSTRQAKKGIKNQSQAGDITCIHPDGNWLTQYFVIECKFYADLNLSSSILFGKGKLAGFWRDLNLVAGKANKYPLLIAKQNRIEPLVIMDDNGLRTFKTFGNNVDIILTTRGMVKLRRAGYAQSIAKFHKIFGP